MTYENIIVEKEDGVATLTLNRPEKLNALDPLILQEAARAVQDVIEDDEVKVLIITGAGRGFCSGADLAAPVRGTDPKQPGIGRRPRLEPFISFGFLMKKLRNLQKPAIAAVNGAATGAGLALACLCDIRIASENARFSSIFVRRGLVADCGTSYLLPRIVGTARALELMFTGDIIDAREAERIGLVSRVVPHEELMGAVKELAVKIAKGPSISIELMKRMVYEGLEADSFSLQIAYEGWAQEMCYVTEDFEEGVNAFLEKREAVFKGR